MNWLDIAGTIIGLVYIYQEYKASIRLWVTGLIMPMVYMFVYYEAGLYADFGMQVYYVLAAIYGLLVWKYGKKRNRRPRNCPSPRSNVHSCCPRCSSSLPHGAHSTSF